MDNNNIFQFKNIKEKSNIPVRIEKQIFQIENIKEKTNIPVHIEKQIFQFENQKNTSNKKEEVHVKTFKRAKKIKKAKLVKSKLKKALLTGVSALITGALVFGVLSAPAILSHMKSSETTNQYANENAITYVETQEEVQEEKEVEDNIPWGTLTEEQQAAFTGNVTAQLSDVGDILDTTYPIAMETSDNPGMFLNHDINGDYNEAGSIFKDYRNHESLSDDITYIYGHNLIDGNMFGRLSGYTNQDFIDGMHYGQDLYNQQKELYGADANNFIWTDEYGQYRLDICAAGEYNAHDMINLPINFNNDEDKQLAINYINEGSQIKADHTLDLDSKIAIFQTCKSTSALSYDDNSPNKEFVVCKVTPLMKFKELPTQNKSGKSLS